jgi:hypothetical protein
MSEDYDEAELQAILDEEDSPDSQDLDFDEDDHDSTSNMRGTDGKKAKLSLK